MNTFIISFRESLEAALIIGIIFTILKQKSLAIHIKFLWLGVVAALLSSVAFAFGLEWVNGQIQNESMEKLMEGVLMIVTAGFVYYVIFWLSKQVSSSQEIEHQTMASTAKRWGVFWMVYFTILREGFETVMFLFSSEKMSTSYFYLNFFLGIVVAVFLGYLIFIQGRKVDLRKFFKVTSFLLVIFASGMIAYGIHELEEFVVKGNHLSAVGIETKEEIGRVWDILQPVSELSEGANETWHTYNAEKGKYIHLLHDKGSIGSFLKGFIGYNSNPNWIEFICWMLSFVFGIYLWRKS